MDPSVALAIWQTYERCNTWSTSSIMLNVCKSLDSPDTVEYNFGRTIGRNSRRGPKKYAIQPVRVYLPPEYNENNAKFREKTIAPLLSRACANEGFSVMIKGWEVTSQRLRFCCQRGRRHVEGTRKGKVCFCYLHHFLVFCYRYHFILQGTNNCVARTLLAGRPLNQDNAPYPQGECVPFQFFYELGHPIFSLVL
jgi:hypothetical protein